MTHVTRRKFLQLAGTLAAGMVIPTHGFAQPRSKARVIVIGGGFGGATCANYLRRYDPSLDVSLVERDKQFITCPFSNTVIGGLREMEKVTHGYDNLRSKRGVNVIHDEVVAIDPASRKIRLKSGKTLQYDKLVVSPGIDFRWGAVRGYNEAASNMHPHAWKAGQQTITLSKQLRAMKDGGVFLIAPPDNPFRCPPGPYERVGMVAHYLKQHKPKSKILILDAKDKFSKQPLFFEGWDQLYPGMIEWVKGTAGGKLDSIDVKNNTVVNEIGDRFKGDVINLIPPQKAGLLAHAAGLADKTGWCPVNQKTFASSLQKDIHVIGDASIAGKMPKSGFAASSQGKVCAAAIVAELYGISLPEPSYVNTCYSLVGPDYGISVAAVYRLTDKGIDSVQGAGGVSPLKANAHFRKMEADYAYGWYQSITADTFG